MTINQAITQPVHIEERSFNAWPALHTIYYDGWLLHFANGYTNRGNSVKPIYPSREEAAQKIAFCEAAYRAQGLKTAFKMTDFAQPAGLDDLLARRGYDIVTPTSVQACELDAIASPILGTVTMAAHLTDSWLDAFCRLNNAPAQHIPTMRHILTNIVPERRFAALHHQGAIAAVGLGVLERGYIGFFDIVTDKRLRRQGFGTQLMLHLMHWGRSQGASGAYLQVVATNQPAVSLYHKLGFRELYQYWYRVKPLDHG
jgi:GNAT superfamily N-acetyltransferase